MGSKRARDRLPRFRQPGDPAAGTPTAPPDVAPWKVVVAHPPSVARTGPRASRRSGGPFGRATGPLLKTQAANGVVRVVTALGRVNRRKTRFVPARGSVSISTSPVEALPPAYECWRRRSPWIPGLGSRMECSARGSQGVETFMLGNTAAAEPRPGSPAGGLRRRRGNDFRHIGAFDQRAAGHTDRDIRIFADVVRQKC